MSRMTPRLLTCREGETEELSMEREKLLTLERVVFVPKRRNSVSSLFSLKMFEVNQEFMLDKQEIRVRVRKGVWNLICRRYRAGCPLQSNGS